MSYVQTLCKQVDYHYSVKSLKKKMKLMESRVQDFCKRKCTKLTCQNEKNTFEKKLFNTFKVLDITKIL